MKKIDTEIRHVTKPGANLFSEIGFKPDEAKRLQKASRDPIDVTRLLKHPLMWSAEHDQMQAEADEILRVSRSQVGE